MSTYAVTQRSTMTGTAKTRGENLEKKEAQALYQETVKFLENELGVAAQKVSETRTEFHCRVYMMVVEIEEQVDKEEGEADVKSTKRKEV